MWPGTREGLLEGAPSQVTLKGKEGKKLDGGVLESNARGAKLVLYGFLELAADPVPSNPAILFF
jgi:hypothetical protein